MAAGKKAKAGGSGVGAGSGRGTGPWKGCVGQGDRPWLRRHRRGAQASCAFMHASAISCTCNKTYSPARARGENRNDYSWEGRETNPHGGDGPGGKEGALVDAAELGVWDGKSAVSTAKRCRTARGPWSQDGVVPLLGHSISLVLSPPPPPNLIHHQENHIPLPCFCAFAFDSSPPSARLP